MLASRSFIAGNIPHLVVQGSKLTYPHDLDVNDKHKDIEDNENRAELSSLIGPHTIDFAQTASRVVVPFSKIDDARAFAPAL